MDPFEDEPNDDYESKAAPPGFDGKTSWFAFEDAIHDWCDISELESDKWGPALRNRLEGEAAVYKRFLDREELKELNSIETTLCERGSNSLPISTNNEIHEEQEEIQT